MKTTVSLFSLLAACVFGIGCATDTTPKTQAPREEPPQYVWFDDSTPRSVECTGVQLGRTADGRLRVVAHLRNVEYFRVEVQANCVFMDGQGFTLDEAPFRTLILDENATQDVMFEAFQTNAVKYLVRVRKAR